MPLSRPNRVCVVGGGGGGAVTGGGGRGVQAAVISCRYLLLCFVHFVLTMADPSVRPATVGPASQYRTKGLQAMYDEIKPVYSSVVGEATDKGSISELTS